MKKVPVIVKFSLSIDFPNIVDYFEYFGFISAKYDVKSVYFE